MMFLILRSSYWTSPKRANNLVTELETRSKVAGVELESSGVEIICDDIAEEAIFVKLFELKKY